MEDDTDVNPLHTGQGEIRSAADAFVMLKEGRAAKAAAEPRPGPEPTPDPEPALEPEPEPAPHETEASEEAPTEAPVEAVAEPPIDPPASWKKDRAEAFRALPREMQETIAERETERESATNAAKREAAESRKAAEASEKSANDRLQHFESQFQTIIPMLQQQLQGEFSDIKSWQDAQAVLDKDPVRYLKWDVAQKTLANALASQQTLKQESEKRAIEAHNKALSEESAKLREALPELADETKYAKFASDLGKYLKDRGFSQAEINGLTDHRTALIARDAMLYRQAQAARATALEKKVPQVQSPGVGSARGEASADARAARISKAIRAGDYRAIVAAYRTR